MVDLIATVLLQRVGFHPRPLPPMHLFSPKYLNFRGVWLAAVKKFRALATCSQDFYGTYAPPRTENDSLLTLIEGIFSQFNYASV